MNLSETATARGDWRAGLRASCERLVHPAVAGRDDRVRRARLIGLSFAAPLLLAGAIAQVGPAHFALPVSLAMICAVTVISWSVALLAMTRNGTRVELLALGALSCVVTAIVSLGGGLATPLALLLAAPALEAGWLRDSGRALRWGIGASLAGGVVALASGFAGLPPVAPSAWHWLVPALYAGTLWLRRDWLRHLPAEEVPEVPARTSYPGLTIGIDGIVSDVEGPEEWKALNGRPLADCVNVADRVALLCAMAAARDEGASMGTELRMNSAGRGPGGSYRLDMVRDGSGALVASFRDISELVALREELALTREAVKESEQTKSRFLATMSHELRTPLNAIIGFSEVLEHEMLGRFADPRQKEYVQLIHQSGNHLLSIVNSILDVSKIEAGTYTLYHERFRLEEVAQLACTMIEPQAAAKSIAVATEIDATVGEVFLDRRALLQMLLNLLSNAVKFTPRGGKVLVAAKRSGERVELGVSDTGIGIPEADLGRIGKPFVQVENDYARHHDGTGLGLSLVKGLVGLHKGGMAIESAPGEGTTVTLTFNTPPQADIRPLKQHQATTNDDQTQKHEELRKTA